MSFALGNSVNIPVAPINPIPHLTSASPYEFFKIFKLLK